MAKKKSTFGADFKKFISRGNVVDMAVGVVVGGAFSKIVTSLVNDMFMPLLSVLTGSVSFTDLAIALGEGEEAAKFAYGNFLQTVVDFLLIAVCIFAFVKLITKLRKKPEPEAPKEPPHLSKMWRISLAVRFRLSVTTSTITATPQGA